MKHKVFNEYESMTCRTCAAILLDRLEKAKVNHKEIVEARARELLKGGENN